MYDIDSIDRAIEMFIFDIIVAIEKIKYVSSQFNNPQDLLYDFKSWDTIIREFEIIGEASKHLIKSNILNKEYREVVDFRNIITHEYFGINAEEVWDIMHCDLLNFEKVIINLVNNLEQSLKEELIETFIQDNHYLDFIVKKLNSLRGKDANN